MSAVSREPWDELEEALAAPNGMASESAAWSAELLALLDTAGAVRQTWDRIEPQPAFRHAARARFEARVRERSAPRWGWGVLRRSAVLGLAVLVALLVGVAGVAASEQALPGAPLYPVKRLHESVQLALADDALTRAELYADFAERRLAESQQLRAATRDAEAVAMAAQMVDQWERALAALREVPVEPPDAAARQRVDRLRARLELRPPEEVAARPGAVAAPTIGLVSPPIEEPRPEAIEIALAEPMDPHATADSPAPSEDSAVAPEPALAVELDVEGDHGGNELSVGPVVLEVPPLEPVAVLPTPTVAPTAAPSPTLIPIPNPVAPSGQGELPDPAPNVPPSVTPARPPAPPDEGPSSASSAAPPSSSVAAPTATRSTPPEAGAAVDARPTPSALPPRPVPGEVSSGGEGPAPHTLTPEPTRRLLEDLGPSLRPPTRREPTPTATPSPSSTPTVRPSPQPTDPTRPRVDATATRRASPTVTPLPTDRRSPTRTPLRIDQPVPDVRPLP